MKLSPGLSYEHRCPLAVPHMNSSSTSHQGSVLSHLSVSFCFPLLSCSSVIVKKLTAIKISENCYHFQIQQAKIDLLLSKSIKLNLLVA